MSMLSKHKHILKCIELRIFSPAVILIIRDAFIQTVFLPNRIMRQFFNEHNPICLTKVYIRVIQYQNVSTIIIRPIIKVKNIFHVGKKS